VPWRGRPRWLVPPGVSPTLLLQPAFHCGTPVFPVPAPSFVPTVSTMPLPPCSRPCAPLLPTSPPPSMCPQLAPLVLSAPFWVFLFSPPLCCYAPLHAAAQQAPRPLASAAPVVLGLLQLRPVAFFGVPTFFRGLVAPRALCSALDSVLGTNYMTRRYVSFNRQQLFNCFCILASSTHAAFADARCLQPCPAAHLLPWLSFCAQLLTCYPGSRCPHGSQLKPVDFFVFSIRVCWTSVTLCSWAPCAQPATPSTS